MPVLVPELALGDLLERHREVVLRARLHERRREVVEGALAELVVVVVDLASPLRGDDHERVARVDVLEELIDTRMNHGPAMLPAARNSRFTIVSSSSTARCKSSFTITWSNASSRASCSRATASRSSISPPLSVARSRRRRSSSAIVGALTKTVTAPGTSSRTTSAPCVSRSSSGTWPAPRIRSISERSVPCRGPHGCVTCSRKAPSWTSRSNSSSETKWYSRPSRSFGRRSRVVAETASSSSGIRRMSSCSSVPLPAPDVPVMAKTGLAVEEANQLCPLPLGEAPDRLRLADPARVEKAARLDAPELRHGHQHVEDLRRGHVLGRVAEDLLDPGLTVLQVLLQLRAAHADVVRAPEGVHALVERTNRRLRLRLRHHGAGY